MENFTYCAPTKYVFGRGAELKAGEEARRAGMKNVLLVYGGGSAIRSGILDRVMDSLTAEGIKVMTIGGVKPNPTDELVYKGIELCRNNEIDSLFAVGGGSVIDTAKAIALGVPYEGDFWDFFAGRAVAEKALPVATVLTIPAAGSEGSGNCVITHRDGMRKISLRTDMVLRPVFSLLNPELTFTLPPYQTACGIVDMMAHIMERYFTPTADVEITDRVAEGVLTAIIEEAPKVMENPENYQARANIMWSGTLAHNGICGTGRKEDWTSHAMEHEISALYDVAHGAGLAVVFPAWMTFMAHHSPAKIAQFGRRVFGVESHDDTTAALEAIEALKGFYGSLGMPVTFSGLGIESPDIPALVAKLHENKGATIGGYYPLTATETEQIYRFAL